MSDDGQSARRIARLCGTGLLLAIGIGYLAAGVYMNLVPVGPGLRNRVGTRVGDDFSTFYAGAREAVAGRFRAVYDDDALQTAHTAAIGAEAPRYQWAYPPTAGLLLAPLAALPPLAAYWSWVLASLAVTAIALQVAVRDPQTAALVFLFPGVTQAMICNPTGLTNAALLAITMTTLGVRARLAGTSAGLLTYKPHMAWLLPLAFAAGRQPRALAAWCLSAVSLAVASMLAFGAGAWRDFLHAPGRNFVHTTAGLLPLDRMPTVYAALVSNGVRSPGALAAQVAATAAAALAVAFVWRRSPRSSTRALALAAATPLATPYAYDYDLAILVVPFVLLAAQRRLGVAVPGWMLATLWLSPVLVPLLTQTTGWHVGPLLMAALLAQAVRDANATPRPA